MDNFNTLTLTSLGEADPPHTISGYCQIASSYQYSYTLFVRRIHPVQDIIGLRDALLDVWKLEGRGSANIADSNTIVCEFHNVNHITCVYDAAPWTYRGWLIIMDLWVNKNQPEFLSLIPIWVTVSGIPERFQNHPTLMELGFLIGEPIETRVTGFLTTGTAEAWVRVWIRAKSCIKFAIPVKFSEASDPCILRLTYGQQFNFCRLCGSILHESAYCQFHTARCNLRASYICIGKPRLQLNPNYIIGGNPAKRIRQTDQIQQSDALAGSQHNPSHRLYIRNNQNDTCNPGSSNQPKQGTARVTRECDGSSNDQPVIMSNVTPEQLDDIVNSAMCLPRKGNTLTTPISDVASIAVKKEVRTADSPRA